MPTNPPDAVAQAREDAQPFVDTPVLAAKRKAFDAPTQENLDALIAAVRAECAAKVRGECVWASNENGAWETECGRTWEFIDDGPKENGMKFCHNCGKSVRALEAQP